MVKQTVLAVAMAIAAGATNAATFTGGNFTMYDDPSGAMVGTVNDVTGFVDYDNNTFGVASTSLFYGYNWTASGGTFFGSGSYTINTADPAPGASGGSYNVTVGVGQIGGHIDFTWNNAINNDVLLVWNVVDNGNGTSTWTSVDTDADANAIPGTSIIELPFLDFSVNFSFTVANAPTPVPLPAAVWLLGSGLVGLAGIAHRRNRRTGIVV